MKKYQDLVPTRSRRNINLKFYSDKDFIRVFPVEKMAQIRIEEFLNKLFATLERTTLTIDEKEIVIGMFHSLLLSNTQLIIHERMQTIYRLMEEHLPFEEGIKLRYYGQGKRRKLRVFDPKLPIAIDMALFIPNMMLNIIHKNNKGIIEQVTAFMREVPNSSQQPIQKPADAPKPITGEKERFINDLKAAIKHIDDKKLKFTQKNIYTYLQMPRQTFESRLIKYRITQDPTTKLFLHEDTGLQI